MGFLGEAVELGIENGGRSESETPFAIFRCPDSVWAIGGKHDLPTACWQIGSGPFRSGRRGRGFESRQPDHPARTILPLILQGSEAP